VSFEPIVASDSTIAVSLECDNFVYIL